jgi:hypothetical protein
MDLDIHFIAHFETGQLEKRGVKDDSLGIADL